MEMLHNINNTFGNMIEILNKALNPANEGDFQVFRLPLKLKKFANSQNFENMGTRKASPNLQRTVIYRGRP